MRKLLILGVTGSIGQSTLDVVRSHPGRFEVVGVAAGRDGERLLAVAEEFSPSVIAVADTSAADALRERLGGKPCTVFGGPDGVVECVRASGADLCVSAIVGAAGLLPTLEAIDAGMDIALANKETLVAAGGIVMDRVKSRGVQLLPVDSEHSALFQCLQGRPLNSIRRLLITASGGPFRGKTAEEMAAVTPEEALAHPTWSMGSKITIDSATLANKALEVIEAHWLFGLPYDNIDVVVHPQSVVHGMVEFVDGALLAHMSPPDMRLPIQYALLYPERLPGALGTLDLTRLADLSFEEPDTAAFPMLALGLRAGAEGGVRPAVFSAANEEAVGLFLAGKIGFSDLAGEVSSAMDQVPAPPHPDLNAICSAEEQARNHVLRRHSA